MSKVTKRKYVTREVIEDEVRPTGDQIIVRITCGRGNNLHEVESCDGAKYLVSMPKKFRKNVWIKRGDYVIVEPIHEGHKVQAEIVNILYPMQMKTLKKEGLWPIEFLGSSDNPSTSLLPTPPVKKDRITSSSSSHESSDDDDDDLFTNTNHQQEIFVDSASSSEEESN